MAGFLSSFVDSDRAGREQILRTMESAVSQMGTLTQASTMQDRLKLEQQAAPDIRRLRQAQSGGLEESTLVSQEQRKMAADLVDYVSNKYGVTPLQLEADTKMLGLGEAMKKYEARETTGAVEAEVDATAAVTGATQAQAKLGKVTAQGEVEILPAKLNALQEQYIADTANAKVQAGQAEIANRVMEVKMSAPGYAQNIVDRQEEVYDDDRNLKLATIAQVSASGKLDEAKATQLQAIIDNPEMAGDIDDQIKRWQHGTDLMLEQRLVDAGFPPDKARTNVQARPTIMELRKEIKSLEALKEGVVAKGGDWSSMVPNIIKSLPAGTGAVVESAKTLEDFQKAMDALIYDYKAMLNLYYGTKFGLGMASEAELVDQASQDIFGAKQALREELAR